MGKLISFLALLYSVCIGASPYTTTNVNVSGNQMFITGHFLKGTYKEVVDQWHSKIDTVVLSSPGGDLVSAMRVGMWIREHKTAVHISEQCVSACFYTALAGTNVTLGTDDVGLHEFSFQTTGDYPTRWAIYKELTVDYITYMQPDNAYWLVDAQNTPNDQMYWLTPENIKQLQWTRSK